MLKSLLNCYEHRLSDGIDARPNIALPKAENLPTSSCELLVRAPITGDIAFNLGNPIRRVVTSLELCEARCKVPSMPKVAIDKYDNTRSSKDEVWFSW